MQLNTNLNGTMEAETISKNGVNLKKLMVFFMMVCASISLWGQEYRFEIDGGLLTDCFLIDINDEKIIYYGMVNNVFIGIIGEYKIKKLLSSDDAIGFGVENINVNNYDIIAIGEIGVELYNTNTKLSEEFVFSNGDGNKSVYEKLKREQFSSSATTTPSTTKPQTSSGSTTADQIAEYKKKADEVENGSENRVYRLYWYEKAAELGDFGCQTDMALAYYFGYGVPKDGNTALYWHEKALNNEGLYGKRDGLERCVRELKSQGYTATRTKTLQTTTTPKPQPPSTANTQPPSGKIEKVWLEHNVYNGGEKGMNIHVKFSVNNMKGETAVLCANIYYNNEEIAFRCSGGSNSPSIKPAYDNTEYTDYVIFKSYNDFQSSLPRGKSDLKVKVWMTDGKYRLDESDYVYFSLTR